MNAIYQCIAGVTFSKLNVLLNNSRLFLASFDSFSSSTHTQKRTMGLKVLFHVESNSCLAACVQPSFKFILVKEFDKNLLNGTLRFYFFNF